MQWTFWHLQWTLASAQRFGKSCCQGHKCTEHWWLHNLCDRCMQQCLSQVCLSWWGYHPHSQSYLGCLPTFHTSPSSRMPPWSLAIFWQVGTWHITVWGQWEPVQQRAQTCRRKTWKGCLWSQLHDSRLHRCRNGLQSTLASMRAKQTTFWLAFSMQELTPQPTHVMFPH